MTRIRSLKFKISFTLFLIMILLLGLAGIGITYQYNEKIVKRSSQHIEENLQIMSDRINTIFQDGNLCANYLVLNLNQIFNGEQRRGLEVSDKIQTQLSQSVLIFEGIHSIVYITKDNEMYSTDVNLYSQKEQIIQSTFIKQLELSNGKTILFDKTDSCLEYDKDDPVITMGKRVSNVITGKLEGYMFLTIQASYLSGFMENSIGTYCLYDGEGNEVSGTNPLFKIESKNYLVSTQNISGYSWSIKGITDLSSFSLTSYEIGQIIIQNGLIIIVVLSFVGSIVSKMITKPLEELTQGAMRLAEGNMDVEFSVNSNDEIGTLANVFGYMSKRMKELIEKVNIEATKKREFELSLMQEQVKPHFLYNTLDIIIMLIDMKRYKDAQRVTKKLADYYKISLSGSEEFISLGKEIEMIQDYLELQSMRYGDKFTFKFDISHDVLDASVPRMTLQPLVENAIYHGLKYKKDWGNIWVRARREDEHVYIEIEDNGIGMTERTLEKVSQLINKPMEHYGVYSVGHRLQLYYGKEYGITFESVYEKGTLVTIHIPYRESEIAYD